MFKYVKFSIKNIYIIYNFILIIINKDNLEIVLIIYYLYDNIIWSFGYVKIEDISE